MTDKDKAIDSLVKVVGEMAKSLNTIAAKIDGPVKSTAESWREFAQSRMHNMEPGGLAELGPDDAYIHTAPVEMTTLQKEISQWSREMFGSSTGQVALKMKHEHDELQAEVHALMDAMDRHDTIDTRARGEAITKEAADVLFMLFQLVENMNVLDGQNFDLIEATRAKFEVNKARKWELQPNGVYQHVPTGDD